MNQLNDFQYTVNQGETVTLTADISGDAKVTVAAPMEKQAGSPPSWVFKIPSPGESGFKQAHIIPFQADFIGAPGGSRVVFKVSGSSGGAFTVTTKMPNSVAPDSDLQLFLE
jgi:hypothetical protein